MKYGHCEHFLIFSFFSKVDADVSKILEYCFKNDFQLADLTKKIKQHLYGYASSLFQYSQNWSRGIDVKWQTIREDFIVHA